MTRRRWIADRVEGDRAYLLGANASHLSRVLRVKTGQQFDLATEGVVRVGTVVAASADQVEFQLGERIETDAFPQIIVFLSIFKFDRMEWALEKLTELGVAKIYPGITARSGTHLVRTADKRLERWRKITHEAAQQSRRLAPPEVSAPLAVGEMATRMEGYRIVLSEQERDISLKSALQNSIPPVTLAIGPEGGWTDGELRLLRDQGWVFASLGGTILRAETAAIAATAIAMAFCDAEPDKTFSA